MYGSEFYYVLTDSEKEAGLGAILSGISFSVVNSNNNIKNIEVDENLIVTLKKNWKKNPNLVNRDEVIYEYFKDNLDSYINAYSYEENLPNELTKLAQKDDCLQILLRSVMTQLIGITVTDTLNYEILHLEREIHSNKKQKIVYNLVRKVQRFIHEKSSEPLELNKIKMGSILSCARLHLNLWQLRKLPFSEYHNLQIQTYMAIIKEMKTPSSKYKYNNSNIHPKQRYPRMMPLQSYTNENAKNYIEAVYKISLGKPELEFLSTAQIKNS